MVLNKLSVAQLSGPFTQDPAISLKNYLTTNWTATTGYSPPAASSINFDTKFIKLIDNNVIIQQIGQPIIEKQSLGMQRLRYHHFFRIQVLCKGNSAINNRYLIEQHIDSLINGNHTAERGDGFDEFSITAFNYIPSRPDSELTALKVDTKDQTLSRSAATVEVIYDKYQS